MKGMIMSAILSVGLVAGANTLAAENANPFGLVYGGAITENIVGKVNIHPVTYKLHGLDIAANVYTPANYDASKTYPAIVVANCLGILGICGGGGYTIKAAQSDKRHDKNRTVKFALFLLQDFLISIKQ